MIAALFVRADSIYKGMPKVDAWDMERDARNYAGCFPVVAHPPCRAWGRLRHFAKPRPDEKALALFAVEKVRQLGGVLEHPEHSTLWQEAGLPLPGEATDRFGGWTLVVDQFWWGHRARKRTWLYIVGCSPARVPRMPIALGDAPSVVELQSRRQREATPQPFAAWLAQLAERCRK